MALYQEEVPAATNKFRPSFGFPPNLSESVKPRCFWVHFGSKSRPKLYVPPRARPTTTMAPQ